jgi:FkbM family methyltransferase
MRKVFLNLGANQGSDIKNFRKLYGDDYEVYAFEANPICVEGLKKIPNINIIDKAVDVEERQIEFFLGKTDYSSTLRGDKTKAMSGERIVVETIKFSKWVIDNLSEEDEIVLAMDIEGSEYDVIPDLYEAGIMGWFNELYIEFHHRKLKNIDESTHNKLHKQVIETFGNKVYIENGYNREQFSKLNKEEDRGK